MALETISFIALGIAPSLVWLLFYLREDSHPEPKNLLLQIFILGMAAAPLARQLERVFIYSLEQISLLNLPLILVGVAVIEEIIKFMVVRIRVLVDPDFDEPIDAMIYMIVSALGFAAIENIFYLWDPSVVNFSQTLGTALARFVSATLLHALASGIVGYFLARAVFAKKEHWSFAAIGLLIATIFHILFNWLILGQNIFTVGLMLLLMAVVVAKSFASLRRLKSPLVVEFNHQASHR